jgi:hypothetical protein
MAAGPKSGLGAPKFPGATKFVLGSRPQTVRDPTPRIKPAAAGTRNYGKVAAPGDAPAGGAMSQPGFPPPTSGGF